MRKYLNGEMTMTAEQAVSHHDCELGKWLYSDGMSKFGTLPEFRQLEGIHARLHDHVRGIISRKNAGDVPGAENSLKELNFASDKVISLLDVLDSKVSTM